MGKYKKLIIALVALIVAIPTISAGYMYFKLSSMHVPDKKTKSNKEISKEEASKNKDITNILLVGVDGENLDRGNRSDSMMILTIDNKNNNLKLTSLARDTYVDIKGHSTEKLTHAYAYDGPDLLLDTINSNFNLNIEKYITVNFKSFIDIVDIIGGVEVEVTQNDIEMLNKYIKACYLMDIKKDKGSIKLINNSGKQLLNGYQSLAFSRIRYQDSAFARDSRQREVVEAALKKVSSSGLDKYIKVLDKAMIYTKTNLSPTDLISLGYRVLSIGMKDIKQLEFPVNRGSDMPEGKGYVVTWDKEQNISKLKDFLFNNKDIVNKEN